MTSPWVKSLPRKTFYSISFYTATCFFSIPCFVLFNKLRYYIGSENDMLLDNLNYMPTILRKDI